MPTLLAGTTGITTPSNLLDPIVTLMSSLPLGSWPWVVLAVGLVAYAIYRTASALTPDTVEDLGSRHAREMQEGQR